MKQAGLEHIRDVRPAIADVTGWVWIHLVNSSTVSFTYEADDQARLYFIDLESSHSSLVKAVDRLRPTANVWKTTEIVSREGTVFVLRRYDPDRFKVVDLDSDREVLLPVHPAATSAVDTITDFWPDASGVVYMNAERL